ncbi:Caa(3)-type oxidase, subunit IV [Candidatus Zixiibacteriota bacterium]|nr:Caa(3)-type oxidase, subunit IV [candidate division Zixibacteria bacterium]
MSNDKSPSAVHIVPLRVYLMVGAGLLILTALTVYISEIPLGGWNVVVALLIASFKALLVAFFFMHLLYDKKIFLIILTIAILMLATFITLTMFDTMERGRINPASAMPYKDKAVIYEKNTQPAAPTADSSRVPADSVK